MHPILMISPRIRTYLKKVFWPKPGSKRVRATVAAAAVAVLFAAATPGCIQKPVKPQGQATVRTEPAPSGERYYYYTLSRFFKNKGQIDNAIDLMGRVGELDPGSVFVQRELALLHLKNKDPEAAMGVVAAALARHPDDIPLLNIHGRLLDDKNDLAGAAAAYEKIITLDPEQQNTYLFLGGVYSRMKLDSKAVDTYRRMVKKFPRAYAGHFFLGRIYRQQGKSRRAEKAFLKALEIKPDLEEPRLELAAGYLARGKTDQAIEMYRELLDGNPENVKAAMELARLYVDQGQVAEAEPLFRELARRSLSDLQVAREVVRRYIDPKLYAQAAVILAGILENGPAGRDLNYLLGVAYEGLQDTERAILEMKKLSLVDRFYPDAVVRIAFLYQEQKQVNKAIAHLERAISLSPGKAEFYFFLGTLYEETGDLKQALSTLLKGQEREPDNLKIQFRIGIVHDKMGDKQKSIAAMKQVIRMDGNHASALNYLGYTYADMGKNLDEAEALISKALKIKPEDGYITDSLGWVYYQKGRYAEALEMLLKAVTLVSDDPIILEHLGDAYLKMDERGKALESYRRARKVKEKDYEALEQKIRALEN